LPSPNGGYDPRETRPTVLFVMGWGRSGSTILGNVLNKLPGFVHVGELGDTWRRIARNHAPYCGCGSSLQDCLFWLPILTASGSDRTLLSEAREVDAWQRTEMRFRHIPRLIWSAHHEHLRSQELNAYIGRIGRIYGEIARRTGASVIVDTSKDPAHAIVCASVSTVRPVLVHLIRDVRGVVNSCRQPKADYMPSITAWEVIRVWTAVNVASAVVRRVLPAVESVAIRYEDFAVDPVTGILPLLRMVGMEQSSDVARRLLAASSLNLGVNHGIGGNPGGRQRGSVEIRPDDRWRTELPTWTRRAVTAATYPLLKHYRYVR
jgi:hypothetical protein